MWGNLIIYVTVIVTVHKKCVMLRIHTWSSVHGVHPVVHVWPRGGGDHGGDGGEVVAVARPPPLPSVTINGRLELPGGTQL